MNNVRPWFEGELKRMLGFDEVEEIAKFALESFSITQTAELREYLQQFLGESKEVNKLCDELVVKRRGAATTGTGASASFSTGEDFWGRGGSLPDQSLKVRSKRGDQNKGASQPTAKSKGKLYQKAAAEDFWGRGTTSGATGRASSTARSPKSSRPSADVTARSSGAEAAYVSNGSQKEAFKSGRKSPVTQASTLVSATTRTEASDAYIGACGVGGKDDRRMKGATSRAPRAETSKPSAAKTKALSSGRTLKPTANKVSVASAEAPTPADTSVIKPVPEWSGVTCLCMATKHDLITNCTSCGKIACVVEGGFGCSFCGSKLPVTGHEPKSSGSTIASGADSGKDSNMQSSALREALARKEKLLLFDRTSASRTRVLDDQGDYFTSHNWLSQKEREKAEAEEKSRRDDAAQRRGARRQVKVSIDIMGRKVVEAHEGDEGDGVSGGAANWTSEGAPVDLGSHAGSAVVGESAAVGGNSALGPNSSSRMTRQGLSLENTGLRGRAKEVYDVMRANLEKQGRRLSGENRQAGAGRVAQSSRLSLWRIQHDIAPDDDILRQVPLTGGEGVGMSTYDPIDEVLCK